MQGECLDKLNFFFEALKKNCTRKNFCNISKKYNYNLLALYFKINKQVLFYTYLNVFYKFWFDYLKILQSIMKQKKIKIFYIRFLKIQNIVKLYELTFSLIT